MEERIVALYSQGHGIRPISREVGCSYGTVRNTLIRRGVRIRQRGGDNGGRRNWRGGRVVGPQGYVYIHKTLMDDAFHGMLYSNYALEHRYVMALHLGRPLRKHEQVHHIDGDKKNNAIENLQLRIKAHGSGAAFRCLACGSTNITAEAI